MCLVGRAINNNFKLFSTLEQKFLNLFEQEFSKLNQYGVEDFGYRVIDNLGNSAVITTNSPWTNIVKNDIFAKAMSEHVNSELLSVKQHNLSFVVRSKDRANTTYLQMLCEYGVNNSVVRFKFHQNKIELFYFFYSESNMENRDLILNNFAYINNRVDQTSQFLEAVSTSETFLSVKENLLTNSTLQLMRKEEYKELLKQGNYIKVNYKEHTFYLSKKEINCLMLVKLGVSNKYIANKLGLCETTIKDYISKLKEKFKAISRDQLITIAHDEKMKYLSQITEIK